MQSDLLKGILEVYKGAVIVLDTKKEITDVIYTNGSIRKENISYDECLAEIAGFYSISFGNENDILDFLTGADGVNTFQLSSSYIKSNGDGIKLTFHFTRIDEDKLLVITEDMAIDLESDTDTLTKCYSKSFIDSKINNYISMKEEFGVFLLDIDGFTAMNEKYGHMFGDMVLIEVATALKNVVGDNGYVSRVGGDEFMVFVRCKDSYDGAYEMAESLSHAVRDIQSASIKNRMITVSLGAVTYPTLGDSYDDLFKNAGKALVRSKWKGGHNFVIYSEERCNDEAMKNMTASVTTAKENKEDEHFTALATFTETLNGERIFEKSIDAGLAIIGNHYGLERVMLIHTNPETNAFEDLHIWYANRVKEKPTVPLNGTSLHAWREEMGEANMLKVSNFIPKPTFRLTNDFLADGTRSTLAYELLFEGVSFGLLKFDMLSDKRRWLQDEINSLNLVAKILAIKFKKEYDNTRYQTELYYDKITGIYNFNKWFVEVGKIDSLKSYALMEIVIEDFRSITSIIGVNKSNEILKTIANTITSLEDDDIIFCRRAENAFLLMLNNKTRDYVENVYNTIDKALENKKTRAGRVFINAGVYKYDGNDSLEKAIDKVILACKYNPSSSGILYFDEKIYEDAKFKAALELHMHEAIKRDEFMLYLQPKFDPVKNELVGAEALSRWNFKGKLLLSPKDFIGLFEETGFIIELDFCVFENACKYQRKCIDMGYKVVPISVNVSRYVNDFDEYLRKIEEIRVKYDIHPSLIELEMTEGMFVTDSRPIEMFMDNAHKIGYHFSMDDFGTGYSNLASLASMDFQTIKIDKSFIKDIENPKENIILKSIISLISRLNMKTLCEGVETKDYVDYLSEIGCDIIQGYYYSKPIPSSEFMDKYSKIS